MPLALPLFHFNAAKLLSELKQIWVYLAICIKSMILGNQDLSKLLLVNSGEWLKWDIPYKLFPPVIQVLPIVKPNAHCYPSTRDTGKNRQTEADHLMMFHIQDNIEFCALTEAINPASHDKWPQEKSLRLFRMLIPISVSDILWWGSLPLHLS